MNHGNRTKDGQAAQAQEIGVTMMSQLIDQQCIKTIRTLSIDAVQQTNSGHPGTANGACGVLSVGTFPALRSGLRVHEITEGVA